MDDANKQSAISLGICNCVLRENRSSVEMDQNAPHQRGESGNFSHNRYMGFRKNENYMEQKSTRIPRIMAVMSNRLLNGYGEKNSYANNNVYCQCLRNKRLEHTHTHTYIHSRERMTHTRRHNIGCAKYAVIRQTGMNSKWSRLTYRRHHTHRHT